MNDAKYIGLDVHQATLSVAVRDSVGKLVMEAVLETKAKAILKFLRGLRGSLHSGLANSASMQPSTDLGTGRAPKTLPPSLVRGLLVGLR